MVKYIFLLFILYSISFAQVEHSGKDFRNTNTFDIEFANYPTGKENTTRVDVFVKIPYSSIQFVKSDDSYIGRYSVTITVYDEEQQTVKLEKFWNETLATKNFNEAISEQNYNYSYKSFELPPNRYYINCDVYDKDSKKSMTYKGFLGVYEYSKAIQISDLILIDEILQGAEGQQYLPKVSNQITSRDTLLTFIYEIYSDANRNVDINYTIYSSDKELVVNKSQNSDLNKGINSMEQSIAGIDTKLGNYLLEVRIKDNEFKFEETSSKPLISKIYGFPSSITDLDLAIEQMTYIAGSSVIDEIEDGEDFEERLKRFKAFWKSKDPSPDTEHNEMLTEYYRRIAYANANFKHYFDGWKTDMGMIYIILGPPDNVERHPFDLERKPYEIWDYYDINKRFVFVDQTGFGDYRLLNPQFGDWYRYRQ